MGSCHGWFVEEQHHLQHRRLNKAEDTPSSRRCTARRGTKDMPWDGVPSREQDDRRYSVLSCDSMATRLQTLLVSYRMGWSKRTWTRFPHADEDTCTLISQDPTELSVIGTDSV